MIKDLVVVTAATDTGKTTIVINGVKENPSNTWYYDTASTIAGLEGVTYNTAITTANWDGTLSANGTEISATNGYYVRVVEVDSNSKPVAVGDALINAG